MTLFWRRGVRHAVLVSLLPVFIPISPPVLAPQLGASADVSLSPLVVSLVQPADSAPLLIPLIEEGPNGLHLRVVHAESMATLRPSLVLPRLAQASQGEQSSAVPAEVLARLAKGTELMNGGRWKEAQAEFEQILALTADPLVRASALLGLGRIFFEQGEVDPAQQRYEEVLKVTQHGHRSAAVWAELRSGAFMSLATIFLTRGKVEDAHKVLLEALKLMRTPDMRANVQTALGGVLHLQGKWEAAQEAYEAAIRQARNPEILAAAYGNLGVLLHNLGWSQEAAEKYRKAIDLARIPDRKAAYLQHLGAILLEADKPRDAFQVSEEAFRLATNPNSKAAALGSMAAALHVQGKLEDARALLENALTLSNERLLRTSLLTHLGLTLSRLGKPEQALIIYQEALASVAEAVTAPEAAAPSPNPPLASIRLRDDAINILAGKALALRELADRTPEGELPRTFLRGASQSLALAVEVTESLRREMKQEKTRIAVVQKQSHVYDEMVGTLLALDQVGASLTEPALQRLGQTYQEVAFHYAERGKARALVELLATSRSSAVKDLLAADLAARETELMREVIARQKAVAQLAATPDMPPPRLATATAALTQAEVRLEAFVDQLRQGPPAHRAYAALKYPQPPTIRDLPLEADEALLEFKVTEAASYLWVVRTGHALRLFLIPGRPALEAQVKAFLDPAQAHDLYKLLRFPEALAGIPPGTRLVIVPDDILFRLPFELLVTRVEHLQLRSVPGELPFYPGVRYLAQDWAVSYYPSAGTLVVNRQRALATQAWSSPLLALGDPEYSPDGGRGVRSAGPASARRSLVRAAAAKGYLFEPLPATRREILAIAKIFRLPADSPHLLLGERATKEVLLRRDLTQYRFLHFATHGLLGVDVPGLQEPALVLSHAGPDERQMFLTMQEVFALQGRLNAELVVLSACRTGRGKEFRGEGVIGLTRAFFYAAAPSVVVSLWNVNDAATAHFMARFYHHLVNDRQDKATALQRARLDLLHGYTDPETGVPIHYPQPFFWAPFILVGER